MAGRIQPKPRLCQIGDDVLIDVCTEETHELANTVTDHPVEDGANISDHVRPQPDRLTLNCFVSNTPLSTQQQQRTIQEGSFKFTSNTSKDVPIGAVDGRGANTFAALKKLRDNGTLVQVVTTLKTYALKSTEGMVIESLTIPRRTDSYDGLEWSVTFKQIRIVKNQQTRDIKAKEKQVQPKKKTGTQTTSDGSDENSAALNAAKDAEKSSNMTVSNWGKAVQGISF
jgi:hypothetical protein